MAFRVPDDLADLDLTLTEVKRILDVRKASKRTQTRLDNLPARATEYEAELDRLKKEEASMLLAAVERRKADEARQASAAQGERAPAESVEDGVPAE